MALIPKRGISSRATRNKSPLGVLIVAQLGIIIFYPLIGLLLHRLGSYSLSDHMALTKKRQSEILRLTYQGGDELTAAMEAGEAATQKHLRKINREIDDFVTSCDDKRELDFFAANWPWDGNVKPILKLITNPNVDAGTLLRMYWYACPEDYYLFHRSASELDPGYERDVFTVIRRIETRLVKGDYKTATVPFDPSSHVSMPERHDEFARSIPDVMFQPITGKKRKRG